MKLFRYIREEYFPIRILDKYLFKEFVLTFIGTVLLLTGIMLISNIMDNMKDFIASKQPAFHIYLYILYSLPFMISLVVAPALMFSVCFVVAQFSVNKELVSTMAAGVSFYRTVSPLIFFGFLMWFALLGLNEYVVRPANKGAENEKSILLKGAGSKSDLIYQYHIKGKEGFYYIYFYDRNEKRIRGGFNYIRMKRNGIPDYVISAENASYDWDRNVWTMSGVEEIQFDDTLDVTSYKLAKEKDYLLPETPDYFAKPKKSPGEMTFSELEEEIQIRKGKGIPYADLQVEQQAIFAVPLMSFIVVIIGSIAGSFTTRTAGVASLGITIAVVLIYYILYSAGRSLGESGVIPASIAVWFTPTLFLGICYYLYKKLNL